MTDGEMDAEAQPSLERYTSAQAGRHFIAFEPPSTIHVVTRGEFSEEDIRLCMDFLRPRVVGMRYVLLMVGVMAFEMTSAMARRSATESAADIPYRGTVMYGASLRARILSKMISLAVRLMTGRDNPVHFVATESEARAWVAARRKVLDAEVDR